MPLLFTTCKKEDDTPTTTNNSGNNNTGNNGLTYVPDDNFEQHLISIGYDDTLDNYVTTSGIDTLTGLWLSGTFISDLTGIEDFSALIILECHFNNLTSLDVSNNLALTRLFCRNNQLTSINVRNGNNINFLDFSTINNPNLNCISVDDPAYSTANWADIDPQHYFSEQCP